MMYFFQEEEDEEASIPSPLGMKDNWKSEKQNGKLMTNPDLSRTRMMSKGGGLTKPVPVQARERSTLEKSEILT